MKKLLITLILFTEALMAQTLRKADYEITSLILNRWSPRSMTGESMTDAELLPLFEAARFAPSSFNDQPWIFLYAKRDTPEWKLFHTCLVEFNQKWTASASALVCMVSRNTFEKNGKPSPTHSFDTGAAWMALALEGYSRGYVVHGMSGFDFEKARTNLQVPDGYTVEAMCAIGKYKPDASEEISGRKPLSKVAVMGPFPQ